MPSKLQFIVSSYDPQGQKITLWRYYDYEYELEISSADKKKIIMLSNMEYNDAMSQFNDLVSINTSKSFWSLEHESST
jgi:hypothetical protein